MTYVTNYRRRSNLFFAHTIHIRVAYVMASIWVFIKLSLDSLLTTHNRFNQQTIYTTADKAP